VIKLTDMAIDSGAPGVETGITTEAKRRHEFAGDRVAENPEARTWLFCGDKLGKKEGFAAKLGLANPLEAHYAHLLVADSIMRDMGEKRKASSEFLHDSGEKALPKFLQKIAINRIDKKDALEVEGQKIFSEYLKITREVLGKSVGESRTRTIESAMHDILTTGLVKGGKQGDIDAFNQSVIGWTGSDIEQWSNRWRQKLEPTYKSDK
jgi:hypothetical protein